MVLSRSSFGEQFGVLAGMRLLISPSGAGLDIQSVRGGALTIQEVDHKLIGAHHDGGVGDLPH